MLPEGLIHEGSADLLKQGLLGLAIIVLSFVVVVLWRDNLKLRSQIEADADAREKRDDNRFGEVRGLVDRVATALEKSAGSLLATSAAAEQTNALIDKQGNLIEARTAIFQDLRTAAAINREILTGNRDAINACKQATDTLAQRVDAMIQRLDLVTQRFQHGGNR